MNLRFRSHYRERITNQGIGELGIMRHRKVPGFLRDANAAFRWAKRNVGDIKDDVDEMNKEEPSLGDEFYGHRAAAYSDFTNEAYRNGQVVIYRAIQVPVLNGIPQISWSNLGKSWSRTTGGVGVYGIIPYGEVPLREVLLQGTVKPQDIDWEYGFASFMYYGEDQWEVSMLSHSPVVVTHVDYDQLPDHILGDVGPAQEIWRPLEV